MPWFWHVLDLSISHFDLLAWKKTSRKVGSIVWRSEVNSWSNDRYEVEVQQIADDTELRGVEGSDDTWQAWEVSLCEPHELQQGQKCKVLQRDWGNPKLK